MGANEPVLNKAILIMDMPEKCTYCICADGEYGTCNAIHDIRGCDWQKRPQWCPLIPFEDWEKENEQSNLE